MAKTVFRTSADVPYDNAVSGLVADDVKAALDELAAAVVVPPPPPPPGAITAINGGGTTLTAGEVVRVNPGMANQVVRASASLESESHAIGVVVVDILPAAPGSVGTIDGVLNITQFEVGLALSEGDQVYLSPLTPGAVTNVQPVTPGQVNKPMGEVFNASAYVGTMSADSLATIVLRIEQGTVVT